MAVSIVFDGRTMVYDGRAMAYDGRTMAYDHPKIFHFCPIVYDVRLVYMGGKAPIHTMRFT